MNSGSQLSWLFLEHHHQIEWVKCRLEIFSNAKPPHIWLWTCQLKESLCLRTVTQKWVQFVLYLGGSIKYDNHNDCNKLWKHTAVKVPEVPGETLHFCLDMFLQYIIYLTAEWERCCVVSFSVTTSVTLSFFAPPFPLLLYLWSRGHDSRQGSGVSAVKTITSRPFHHWMQNVDNLGGKSKWKAAASYQFPVNPFSSLVYVNVCV